MASWSAGNAVDLAIRSRLEANFDAFYVYQNVTYPDQQHLGR